MPSHSRQHLQHDEGKTYKKNCTVARSELRYLRCLHTDKEGRSIVGEMVVNKAIANDVLDILTNSTGQNIR